MPPTNLPYIKTAMDGFAPLSRENLSNWIGFFDRTGTNAEHQHLAVWVLGHEALSITAPPAKLPVQGTLQFWLQIRVKVVA